MANTFTSLHYHVVFSTKNREPWVRSNIEQRVWSYLGGIARENDMKPLMIGGIENHVHLLLGIAPTMTVSKAVKTFEEEYRTFLVKHDIPFEERYLFDGEFAG